MGSTRWSDDDYRDRAQQMSKLIAEEDRTKGAGFGYWLAELKVPQPADGASQ